MKVLSFDSEAFLKKLPKSPSRYKIWVGHLKSKVDPLNTLFGGMLGFTVAVTENFLCQVALIPWK